MEERCDNAFDCKDKSDAYRRRTMAVTNFVIPSPTLFNPCLGDGECDEYDGVADDNECEEHPQECQLLHLVKVFLIFFGFNCSQSV